jgi:hypothetical protein
LIINGVEYDIYVNGQSSGSGARITLTQSVDFTIGAGVNLTFRTFERDKIIGGWDIHDREYVVSMQKAGSGHFRRWY